MQWEIYFLEFLPQKNSLISRYFFGKNFKWLLWVTWMYYENIFNVLSIIGYCKNYLNRYFYYIIIEYFFEKSKTEFSGKSRQCVKSLRVKNSFYLFYFRLYNIHPLFLKLLKSFFISKIILVKNSPISALRWFLS